MKSMISIWLLLLALMCFFTSSVISEDKPYVPPPSSGEGSDDSDGGHPWGGDDNSIGNIGGKDIGYIETIWETGFPVLDIMIFVIKREWILVQLSSQTASNDYSYENTGGSIYETQSPSEAIINRRSSSKIDRTLIR